MGVNAEEATKTARPTVKQNETGSSEPPPRKTPLISSHVGCLMVPLSNAVNITVNQRQRRVSVVLYLLALASASLWRILYATVYLGFLFIQAKSA